MCDGHLVEISRLTGRVKGETACCYCRQKIAGEGIVIEGHLDDGSPGLHRFAYHEVCAWGMEHDLQEVDEHDGCFSYGTALVIHPASGGLQR